MSADSSEYQRGVMAERERIASKNSEQSTWGDTYMKILYAVLAIAVLPAVALAVFS